MKPSDGGLPRGVMVRRRVLYAAALLAMLGLVLAGRLPGTGASAATLHAALQPKSKRVARVRAIRKGLAVQPPHRKTGKGKVKQPLYVDYGLATAAGQKASVAFTDGSLLQINQRTDLLLRSPNRTVVRKGEVDQIITPGSNHVVQTASAVASAIGTNFDLRILHGNVTGIVVVEGAVLVKNAAGSVVVETGQQTTVAKGKAPAPPTPADPAAQTAWTQQLPSPSAKVGQNVALNANGGGVVGFSSQRQSAAGTWDAANIIDGRLDRGWASGPVAGSASTREWVKIALDSASPQEVSEVVINPAATGGLDMDTDLKEFEIWVSTTGTDDANFTIAASGTALQQNGLQRFVLPSPVRARYVELVARTNYGSTVAISVAEIEIVGVRAPVVTPTPTATDTATPTPAATSTATLTVVPSPSATPTPTATPLPDIILGSLAIYAATGPLSSGGATCSAPGEVQTSTIHALDPYMYVKQSITRWQGTHTWRVDWLTPAGTLIVSPGDQSQTDSTSALCWYLALGGEPTLSMAGTWTVNIYIDDSLAATGSYTMVDNRTTPSGSVVISQSTVWREPTTLPPPHTTTCTFPGQQQSSVILTTDVAELTKHEVSSWSGTHTLWGEWYRPNGTLYDWLPLTATDAGTSEWCFYNSVAGGGIGSVPGNWHFKVYTDATPAGDLPFTVQSAAARSRDFVVPGQ